MAKIGKGYLWGGWDVEEPNLGNGFYYVATCPAMQGVWHKEHDGGAMRRWCEAHDMTAQCCAMIDRGELTPPARKPWMDVLGV